MKTLRILSLAAAAAGTLVLASCCCSSESKPAKLDKMPNFPDFQAPATVHPAK